MVAPFRGKKTGRGNGRDLTPGECLRAEIERLGLDQVAVSRATGVSRQSINNIINGRQPISRAMAGKLGRLTGHSSDYWLRASFPREASKGARLTKSSGRDEARGYSVAILVNHQIVKAVTQGIIGIDPFNEHHVRLASLDLTLADADIGSGGAEIGIGDTFRLGRGRLVRASSRERIELPLDYIGRIGSVDELAGLGVLALHPLHVAPGFKGRLQFSLFNAGQADVVLRSGEPVVSVEFMPLGTVPTRSKTSK